MLGCLSASFPDVEIIKLKFLLDQKVKHLDYGGGL